MSKRKDVLMPKSIKVAENVSEGRFIDFDGNYAENGEAMSGVAIFEAESGSYTDIAVFGRMYVELEATVSKGQAVTCGTDGKAKVATTGDNVGGYAVEAGNNGDFVVIQLNLNLAMLNDNRKIDKVSVGHTSGKVYDIPEKAVITGILFNVQEQYTSTGTIEVDFGNGDGTSGTDADGYLVDINGTDPASKSWFGFSLTDRGVLIADKTDYFPIEEYHPLSGDEIHLNVDADCDAGSGTLYICYYTLP